MKKFFAGIFSFFILYMVLGTGGSVFAAAEQLPLSDTNLDSIIKKNKFEVLIPEKDSQDSLKKILTGDGRAKSPIIVTNVILGAVAFLWIVMLGIKFVVSDSEEDFTKLRLQFGWIVVGLGVVSVAEYAAFTIFDPDTKNILTDTKDTFFSKAKDVIRFVEYIIGGIVLVMGSISGYQLISSGDEDDKVTQEKDFIKSFLFAILLILVAEIFVRGVFYVEEERVDAIAGVTQVAGIINFILTFVSGAAVFMVILASIYYTASFGQEDQMNRAKQMIISSVTALVIIFSVYTIASFLVRDITLFGFS